MIWNSIQRGFLGTGVLISCILNAQKATDFFYPFKQKGVDLNYMRKNNGSDYFDTGYKEVLNKTFTKNGLYAFEIEINDDFTFCEGSRGVFQVYYQSDKYFTKIYRYAEVIPEYKGVPKSYYEYAKPQLALWIPNEKNSKRTWEISDIENGTREFSSYYDSVSTHYGFYPSTLTISIKHKSYNELIEYYYYVKDIGLVKVVNFVGDIMTGETLELIDSTSVYSFPAKKHSLPITENLQGEENISNKEEVYTFVEKMPQFPGGMSEMFKFISTNLQYPQNEKNNDIERIVYLTFVVNKAGVVTGVKILKGIAGKPNFDKEALRVVKTMPNWVPGMQNGREVNVQFNLPIKFKIAK